MGDTFISGLNPLRSVHDAQWRLAGTANMDARLAILRFSTPTYMHQHARRPLGCMLHATRFGTAIICTHNWLLDRNRGDLVHDSEPMNANELPATHEPHGDVLHTRIRQNAE